MTDNEATRRCPDCAAEAGDGLQPLSAFPRVKAARYAGGYRYGAYCTRHQQERTKAAHKAALADDRPAAETIRRVKRDWAREHKENARQNSAAYRNRKKDQAE